MTSNLRSIALRHGRLPLALGGAALVAACSRSGGTKPDSAAAATPTAITVGPENVTLVTRDSIQSGPSISGSLQPERQATLRAEATGTVTATYAEAGQRVGQGTVLARIETTGLTDAVLSARSAVTSARLASQTAQRNAERNDRLLTAGAIAERDAEAARTQASAAASQLATAQAQLANAERQLSNTTARAPFGGIVGLRSVNTGDVVNVGAALYTVVDPSSMQLEASVPADELAQVRVGAPVRFSVNGYPGRTFVGRISRVAPVADPVTRQVRIIAALPNAGNTLVGGLFAEGRVSSEARSALVVPASAIDQRGTTPVVVRLRGGKVEHVNVELGLRDEATERVEIRSGAQLGDTLLLGQAQAITAGTPIKVSAPSDQPARSPSASAPATAPATVPAPR